MKFKDLETGLEYRLLSTSWKRNEVVVWWLHSGVQEQRTASWHLKNRAGSTTNDELRTTNDRSVAP